MAGGDERDFQPDSHVGADGIARDTHPLQASHDPPLQQQHSALGAELPTDLGQYVNQQKKKIQDLTTATLVYVRKDLSEANRGVMTIPAATSKTAVQSSDPSITPETKKTTRRRNKKNTSKKQKVLQTE